MIEDMLVVDAVVHPYNLAPNNQNPAAVPQLETVYAAHCMLLELPDVQSVEVGQTATTLWTPDRMGRELPGG